MTDEKSRLKQLQSVTTDKFFYFFMGLRKGEIRRRVAALKERHPEDSPEHLARRLIAAQVPLSILGGALLYLPTMFPGIGPALKILSLAGGEAVMMRMNMALILEIAQAFGRDIDDRARLKEMAAVIAATGLTSAMPFLTTKMNLKRWSAVSTGGAAIMSINELIGEAAIQFYARSQEQASPEPKPRPTPVPVEVSSQGADAS